jgi:hypothetical protein
MFDNSVAPPHQPEGDAARLEPQNRLAAPAHGKPDARHKQVLDEQRFSYRFVFSVASPVVADSRPHPEEWF